MRIDLFSFVNETKYDLKEKIGEGGQGAVYSGIFFSTLKLLLAYKFAMFQLVRCAGGVISSKCVSTLKGVGRKFLGGGNKNQASVNV